MHRARHEKSVYDEKVLKIKRMNHLNEQKDVKIDSRLKYLRQKIMVILR